jgi:ATP-binding cassette subfamily F protein 3
VTSSGWCSRGGVAPFDGDLDDYQRYLLDEAKRQGAGNRSPCRLWSLKAAATPSNESKPTTTPDSKSPEQTGKLTLSASSNSWSHETHAQGAGKN